MTKKCEDVPSDCFAHQKFSLYVFGLQPKQNNYYKLYSVCLLIVLSIYPFSVIPEVLKIYYADFDEFIFSILYEVENFVAVICMHCLFWNRSELMKLFETLQHLDELSNFGNTKSNIAFIKEYKDIVRKQGYLGSSIILFVLISYTSASVLLSFNKERWILPFGSGAAINNNNVQFILQISLLGAVAAILYLLLFIYINVLTLICGHCKLLQKCIQMSLSGHKEEIFQNNAHFMESKIIDWESFKLQIRHIVRYHIGIIAAADQMEAVFSLAILVFFGGICFYICLVIYHSELKIGMVGTLKDVIGVGIGCLLMIIISSYGEKVTTESGKIASICYAVDFANCDLRIQKSIILIMVRSQRPITPSIGKLKTLSLSTMLSLFQSIYSYYTFLRNMKSD